MKMRSFFLAPALTLCMAGAHAQDQQVFVICAVQADWCALAKNAFTKATGIDVKMVQKATGEALAQILAERQNPKTDLLFGATGDAHLQLAEQDLTLPYKSPLLPQLHPWAQRQAETANHKTVGIYSGPLGFGFNTELMAKKKLPIPRTWQDLLKPEYKGEIMMANPNSSGTAYTLLATLVQIMGEEKAFEYVTKLNENIVSYPRSGAGPIKAVARGEATIALCFLHDISGEKAAGFPVESVTPAEGSGAEVGSMSIVKGAPNLENAKKFYDWALTPAAQQLGAAAKQFQLPSNPATPVTSQMPDFKKVKLIDYDYAKYGSAAVRRQLLVRWERSVKQQ
jgi:iron(III) transport system substrate-binding protein